MFMLIGRNGSSLHRSGTSHLDFYSSTFQSASMRVLESKGYSDSGKFSWGLRQRAGAYFISDLIQSVIRVGITLESQEVDETSARTIQSILPLLWTHLAHCKLIQQCEDQVDDCLEIVLKRGIRRRIWNTGEK